MNFRQGAVRLVIYACVGAAGTLAQYLTLFGLVRIGACGAVAASTIGMILGAGINYLLNYYMTFDSRVGHRQAAPRFFIVAAAGLGVNALGMHTLTPYLSILPSQLSSTLAVLLFTYTINSVWSFRR